MSQDKKTTEPKKTELKKPAINKVEKPDEIPDKALDKVTGGSITLHSSRSNIY
jgi:hypothetical protein